MKYGCTALILYLASLSSVVATVYFTAARQAFYTRPILLFAAAVLLWAAGTLMPKDP